MLIFGYAGAARKIRGRHKWQGDLRNYQCCSGQDRQIGCAERDRDDFRAAHQLQLTAMENAAPGARRDVERFFEKLVPEDADYEHDDEGPDDMPSHIRMLRNDYHQQKRISSQAIILL